MTMKIPNVGEAFLLEAMLGKTAPGSLTLCLYTSNTTPADTDVLGTYTEMGAVQGYTSKTLSTGSWGSATAGTGTGTSSPAQATIAYPQQTWTFDGTGGAQTVYGYFLKSGSILVLVERFAGSVAIANAGDTIKVTPQIQFSTQ